MLITTIKKLSITPRYLVKLRRDAVGGRVRVGLVQQRLDGGEDGGDVVGGAPPVLEDVEADAAVRVDVGMEHLGQELHHRRLVGILLAELQGQLECSILTSVVRIKYILLGRQFWILQVRENKFALLWGEAQLCLPYVCL